MKKDYLWDGSGEPDPEIQKLERMLRPLRYDRPIPIFPEIPIADKAPPWKLRLRSLISWQLAYCSIALFVVAILVGAGLWYSNGRTSYGVVSLEGAPRVNAVRILESGRLRIGQWLETDGSSRAQIQMGIGQVEIEPNTILRLEQARSTEHRLSLKQGVLHALIWAPPRLFSVEIPSARAVDLGCAYTLTVDRNGGGLIRVTAGWVAFENGGRESFVPAGAMCRTLPGKGPGTPFQGDSSPKFRAALDRFDFQEEDPQARSDALAAVLYEARREDALTLWHLLAQPDNTKRAQVYDRFIQLVPPPAGVTREGVLALNPKMLDLLWNRLGLGDAHFWRQWEQPYPVRK